MGIIGKRSVTSRLSIISLVALAIPAFAAAQRGGTAVSAPAAAGHAGSMISHAAAAPAGRASGYVQSGTRPNVRIGTPIVRSRSGARVVHRANTLPIDFNGTDFQDVPGLGFDYPHLAAVSGNRRLHSNRFNNGFPFGFSGFLLSPSVIVEQAPAAESEIASAEGEATDEIADNASDAPRPRRHSRPSHIVNDSQLDAAPAPLPEAEQYVFVRRDGRLVFAVGYTWENGTLRYITPDGFRRSIGREALDLSATQQFNEQRGVNFHAPA